MCSVKYPAASGPPVDRTCEQCGSTFKVCVHSTNFSLDYSRGQSSCAALLMHVRVHVHVCIVALQPYANAGVGNCPMTHFVLDLARERFLNGPCV